MKLTGKVVKIESGSEFTDKLERAYIRVDQQGEFTGDPYSTFRVPNDGYILDQTLDIYIGPVVKQLSRAAS